MNVRMKYYSKIAKALAYFTQIALTALVPIGLWLFIAEFIRAKFDLGSYVTVIGIILGVVTAYVNLFKLFAAISRENTNGKRNNDNDKGTLE